MSDVPRTRRDAEIYPEGEPRDPGIAWRSISPDGDLGQVIGNEVSSYLRDRNFWIVPERIVLAAQAAVDDIGDTDNPYVNELAEALEELRNLRGGER